MVEHSGISIDVIIVGNPSLRIEEANVTLNNEWLVNAHRLITDVGSLCNGQPHRIYWRVTELDYLPISGYIELKAALNMMHKPGLYVVQDEPRFMFTEFSDENFDDGITRMDSGGSRMSQNEEDNDEDYTNEYDISSLLGNQNYSEEGVILTDLEILRCAMGCRRNEEKSLGYDCLMTKTRPFFTREKEEIDRQIDVLMKGFPEAKATAQVDKSFAETKNISSAGTSSSRGARKKSEEFKTDNDVNELSGQEPKRNEGRLDEITNTWRDVKRALSLLCVKTFSPKAAMLEAPPGSREDLVEAARTPCTPTDLDTMLYGYTNSIYVLDHTPESLPDMDMLQLFASPAGRALVTGDNRSTTRGGSTSTSLSRESSSRAKNARRTSSMVSLPTPPPRQRKSSAELYKEAVEILGLTCSLTDSCRCIDCQSNYFDCDDDCGDARTELAAGTPILLDHALSHPLTCSIQ